MVYGGIEVKLPTSLTSVLCSDEWSASCSGCLTRWKKRPVLMVDLCIKIVMILITILILKWFVLIIRLFNDFYLYGVYNKWLESS